MSDTTTEMCFSNLNRKRSKINAALERDKKKGKSAGKGISLMKCIPVDNIHYCASCHPLFPYTTRYVISKAESLQVYCSST